MAALTKEEIVRRLVRLHRNIRRLEVKLEECFWADSVSLYDALDKTLYEFPLDVAGIPPDQYSEDTPDGFCRDHWFDLLPRENASDKDCDEIAEELLNWDKQQGAQAS